MDDKTFVFGSLRLIPAQRMLLDDGKPLRLGGRALDILIALVEGAGETIHKDRLIARAWPDTVVDEGALRVHVAALRKALGDGRAGRRYIANNPGRGYTFVAPVTREYQRSAPATPDGGTAPDNLPVPLTRIVGRDDIVAALAKPYAICIGRGHGLGDRHGHRGLADPARTHNGQKTALGQLHRQSGDDIVPTDDAS